MIIVPCDFSTVCSYCNHELRFIVVSLCFSLCVVLGAHSGDAMWVVRVDMSAKYLLCPIPSSGHMVSLLNPLYAIVPNGILLNENVSSRI